MPDKATRLHTMSPKNRSVSSFHECDGIARRNLIGLSDPSLIRDASIATANARIMRKINEHHKYPMLIYVGNVLHERTDKVRMDC